MGHQSLAWLGRRLDKSFASETWKTFCKFKTFYQHSLFKHTGRTHLTFPATSAGLEPPFDLRNAQGHTVQLGNIDYASNEMFVTPSRLKVRISTLIRSQTFNYNLHLCRMLLRALHFSHAPSSNFLTSSSLPFFDCSGCSRSSSQSCNGKM